VIDKRKAQQLLGETMRDIGILVFVFAPLLFIAVGIMLEAKE
jgi:hypothetical protein